MNATTSQLHRFAHEAMATIFEVIIAGQEETYARQAADTVFREIDRLEGVLSRFDACSDVAQINRLKPGESLRVGLDVLECLQIAAQAHTATGGAFDVTVGPLMKAFRDAKGNWLKVSDEERVAARARVGMERLVLDAKNFSVGVRSLGEVDAAVGVDVDLGAIGKGFALDKAVEIFADWGIEDVLLHGGTSTALALGSGGAVVGCAEGQRGWPVGVAGDWGKAAGFEAIVLSGSAVSGSGTEVKGQHILDPRTGRPAEAHLAAWAIAPSAALSDALSTAFMVMTTEEVQACCAQLPGVSALVVEKRRRWLEFLGDKVVTTADFAARKVRPDENKRLLS